MKKTVLILNVVLFLAVMVGDILYMNFGGLEIKGPTSAGFVLMGALNLFFAVKSKCRELKYPVIMTVGLFFAMLGDIFININFIAGALVFALGHVFYFAAFCRLSPFRRADLIPSAVIFLVSVLIITLVPLFDFGHVLMQLVCIFYALVISLMVGKTISNLMREKSVLHAVLVVGGLLFYFSDLMLVFDAFADVPHIIDTLCLVSYYPAQCLLAFSLLVANPASGIEKRA